MTLDHKRALQIAELGKIHSDLADQIDALVNDTEGDRVAEYARLSRALNGTLNAIIALKGE